MNSNDKHHQIVQALRAQRDAATEPKVSADFAAGVRRCLISDQAMQPARTSWLPALATAAAISVAVVTGLLFTENQSSEVAPELVQIPVDTDDKGLMGLALAPWSGELETPENALQLEWQRLQSDLTKLSPTGFEPSRLLR